jgi:hypothetical protein
MHLTDHCTGGCRISSPTFLGEWANLLLEAASEKDFSVLEASGKMVDDQ